MIDAASFHQQRFGTAPSLVVKSPGRVNLIGDHTDYCGLPVLPMAIHERIEVAASEQPEPGLIAASTLDGAIVSSDMATNRRGWAKYVLAVHDQLAVDDRGARLAIDSSLPATGGLSSSSALSVGCLIALNELWGLRLEPDDIVAGAIAAERAAAIAGGAMDQTVITFARPDHAMLIEFDPPAHNHIRIAEGCVWVAGYSGAQADKGESAAVGYNSFVLATRAAATMLGEKLGRDPGTPPLLSRVRDASAEVLAELPTVTVRAAAEMTGGDDLGLPADRPLNLRVSAEHVMPEGARVKAAAEALETADREALGRLMDESHASLRRYGASTAALDALVAGAREAGAYGARVTGAGFGGWAIALAAPEKAGNVGAAMAAATGGPAFVASPGGGALWSLHGR